VVEWLICKHTVLSSSPNLTEKQTLTNKPDVKTHAYNPSYVEDGDWENLGSRPA
jgi:hypothetical protein